MVCELNGYSKILTRTCRSYLTGIFPFSKIVYQNLPVKRFLYRLFIIKRTGKKIRYYHLVIVSYSTSTEPASVKFSFFIVWILPSVSKLHNQQMLFYDELVFLCRIKQILENRNKHNRSRTLLTRGMFMLLLYSLELKHITFGLLLDVGLLVGYKGFSLISLGDKPLLGEGYARLFLLHMYMQPAWHVRLGRY